MSKVPNRSCIDRVLFVLLLCLVAGCERLVISLYPIGAAQDWLVDPNLAGRWASQDQVWDISIAASGGYRVRIIEGLRQARFDANLTCISSQVIMDLEPNTLPADLPGTLAKHLIPGHSFWLVRITGSRLQLSTLSQETIKDLLDRDPNAPSHLVVGEQLILTDQPGRLRSFLARHKDANDLWTNGIELDRLVLFNARGLLIQDQTLEGKWIGQGLELLITKEGSVSYRLDMIGSDQGPVSCRACLLGIGGHKVIGIYLDKAGLDPNDSAPAIPDMAIMVEPGQSELRIWGIGLKDLYLMMEGQQPETRQQDVLVLRRAQ